jgi:hypothetical protein
MECGFVLTRCSHKFHLECLDRKGIDILFCNVCKRKAHTIMIDT